MCLGCLLEYSVKDFTSQSSSRLLVLVLKIIIVCVSFMSSCQLDAVDGP